jgi:predicted  nucleic acid-binding Zn-ribbon protein
MTQQRRTALKELQKIDVSIQDARAQIRTFDPLFEEIEEPALILEGELGTSRTRLKEMKLEARRLEVSSDERRERIRKLEERLNSVRNLREESAVTTELEMVKRGLENDEIEALTLIDQVRKGEERVTELEAAFKEASDLVEPKKEALLAEREQARSDLASLEKDRDGFTSAMDARELQIYQAIRRGGGRRAISELTEDGACGNCFGMVPLQHQNEVRHGDQLIRCEACGVILAAPEPVDEAALAEAAAAEAEAAEAAAAEEAEAAADDADGGDEEE